MRIVGVAWTLADVVRGYAAFDVRAPRTRRAAQTQEWVRDVPREKRLAFTVAHAMPKIVVTIHGVPRRCPRGASVRCTLRVGNESVAGGPVARRVRVRLPGGGVCVPADEETFGELLNGGGWSASTTPSLSAHGSFAGLAKLTLEPEPKPSPAGRREGARTFPSRRRPRVWTVWSTRRTRGRRSSPARSVAADFGSTRRARAGCWTCPSSCPSNPRLPRRRCSSTAR